MMDDRNSNLLSMMALELTMITLDVRIVARAAQCLKYNFRFGCP